MSIQLKTSTFSRELMYLSDSDDEAYTSDDDFLYQSESQADGPWFSAARSASDTNQPEDDNLDDLDDEMYYMVTGTRRIGKKGQPATKSNRPVGRVPEFKDSSLAEMMRLEEEQDISDEEELPVKVVTILSQDEVSGITSPKYKEKAEYLLHQYGDPDLDIDLLIYENFDIGKVVDYSKPSSHGIHTVCRISNEPDSEILNHDAYMEIVDQRGLNERYNVIGKARMLIELTKVQDEIIKEGRDSEAIPNCTVISNSLVHDTDLQANFPQIIEQIRINRDTLLGLPGPKVLPVDEVIKTPAKRKSQRKVKATGRQGAPRAYSKRKEFAHADRNVSNRDATQKRGIG